MPTGAGGPGLTEDVAAVRQVLQYGDESTIVVAHSYGGIVTAEAGRSLRAMTRIPGGQPARSIRPVSSATNAPGRAARFVRRRRVEAHLLEHRGPAFHVVTECSWLSVTRCSQLGRVARDAV